MTRIIAGAAGGIRLDVPGSGTRPTSERVREAMFGSLESAGVIDDARVLDLYAGSGALALEALSRGARAADLVERSPGAASVATRNADRVSLACGHATARVHRAAVHTYLGRAAGPFDLVFIDPPYELTDADLQTALELLGPTLAPDALVVVERGKRSAEPDWTTAGLERVRARTYGDTTVFWAEPLEDATQPRVESQSR